MNILHKFFIHQNILSINNNNNIIIINKTMKHNKIQKNDYTDINNAEW